jgi:tetratricopeptide (TPR) repeat protein
VGVSRRAAAPAVYRSRRRVLRRLVIPGALAAIMVGAAIGAAASYLTPSGGTEVQSRPDRRVAPSGHPGPATHPVTTAGGPGATASTNASSPTVPQHVSAVGAADGRLLNDQGYALIQQGDYPAAIPPLRRAVAKLRGAGPADPYEAYANYNLGYALLQAGDCASALPPLEVANHLETSPLVDTAIRRATACARQGS